MPVYKIAFGNKIKPLLLCTPDLRDKVADLGYPFAVSTLDPDTWKKCFLYPYLVSRNPDVRWDKVLGIDIKDTEDIKVEQKEPEDTEISQELSEVDDYALSNQFEEAGISTAAVQMDSEKDNRVFVKGGKYDLTDYVPKENANLNGSTIATDYRERKMDGSKITTVVAEDLNMTKDTVNIQLLKDLKYLPKWLDDMTTDLFDEEERVWAEGYNKKLGLCVGAEEQAQNKRNLVIIDVSGSIPEGISSVLLCLADEMRGDLNADLLITSQHSKLYEIGEDLPSPEKLRGYFGWCNEDKEFYDILRNQIRGRHYGTVYCFGDYDAPWEGSEPNMSGTTIDEVKMFHTHKKAVPGYIRWAKQVINLNKEEVCTDWAIQMGM